jgi:hypothetical protein
MKVNIFLSRALGAVFFIVAGLMMTGCSKDEISSSVSDSQVSKIKSSGLTYTLVQASSPTDDQLDAYTRITAAMDAAVAMYNDQTSVTKAITVYYDTSVSTADGNINGTIRFGSNRSYMTQCTAMHEISHTLGVGTSSAYKALVVNGQYTGTNALIMLRSMVGESSSSVLYSDGTHFWPYGLNYNSEWSTVTGQRHARIVGAMKVDGI